MLETFSLATFEPLVGQRFRVRLAPEAVAELELVDAYDLTPTTPVQRGPNSTAGGWEAFSLMFVGPNAQRLGQGMYPFEHDQLGTFSLFIVPIGADEAGTQYEAVFNRRRPAASIS